jgi:hypothetical protein
VHCYIRWASSRTGIPERIIEPQGDVVAALHGVACQAAALSRCAPVPQATVANQVAS